jgi:RNA polymerase sigma factor (TIGR02999 family)
MNDPGSDSASTTSPATPGSVTQWLVAAGQGDAQAVGRLVDLLYDDLRRLAHARLRHGAGPAPLNTTALVNESYLRLVQLERLQVESRSHFMAYAARVMRSVIVDLVREGQAERRGGGRQLVTLDTAVSESAPDRSGTGDAQILAVHEALQALAAVDERLVRVVEMRYFVGLEMDEIAQALGVGKRTVERDWEKARSFLYDALRHD